MYMYMYINIYIYIYIMYGPVLPRTQVMDDEPAQCKSVIMDGGGFSRQSTVTHPSHGSLLYYIIT